MDMNRSSQRQPIMISTTDRAMLETHGVRFTRKGIDFPQGTALASGGVSRSTQSVSTLWRFHLPAPSLLEVSLSQVKEGEQEVLREVSIPLEGAFRFAHVQNTSPAFLARYQEYSHCSLNGNWANEYGDHPLGSGVFIAGNPVAE
jgi:hypothetical protein